LREKKWVQALELASSAEKYILLFVKNIFPADRLFGLVVRVPGYRSRGPRFDSRNYQFF
jgi:hypothetical protein